MGTILTESQKRVLNEWVDLQGCLNNPCLVCQSSEGFVTGDIIAPPLVNAYGNVMDGLFADPVITFECANCGYVLTFRAARIGLI